MAALLIVPMGAAQAGQTTYQVDTLKADFMIPTRTDGVLRYFVGYVTRRTNLQTGDVRVSATLGRGSCRSGRGVFSCRADLKRYAVARYTADPAFATASVVLKRGKRRHALRFTTSAPFAVIPPASHQPTHMCQDGTVTTAYVSAKNATAEGRLFGKKVSTAAEDGEVGSAETMIQTVEVEDCP